MATTEKDKVNEMEIYLKIHKIENEVIVAACDKEILEKKFSQGELQLNVNTGFYCGELKDIGELSNALNDATIANLTGNNVVNFAIDRGFINEENVLEIAGIKHAQIVVCPESDF